LPENFDEEGDDPMVCVILTLFCFLYWLICLIVTLFICDISWSTVALVRIAFDVCVGYCWI
jgi:hypothetical protein